MFKNIIDYTRNLWGFKKKPDIKKPRVITRDEHGIDRRQVSREALRTCENLQAAGYEAYVVGGAVRDLLLGVTPKDFDVVTNATPEQIKRCQRRAIIIGRRFRLVHVMFGREIIECSTFRALSHEGVQKDRSGRVVDDNVFGEMWEDAARRDFTINALYYDPSTEEVIDYHNGMQDIENRTVRMIGDLALFLRFYQPIIHPQRNPAVVRQMGQDRLFLCTWRIFPNCPGTAIAVTHKIVVCIKFRCRRTNTVKKALRI